MPWTRRRVSGLAVASCLAGTSRGIGQSRPGASGPCPRVVVVGGGVGGATAAKYIALAGAAIDVTLIEPNSRYTTCFHSNLFLAGLWPFERLNHGYEALEQQHGIRVVHDHATLIDPAAKTVRLRGGERLAYDRLVVAPGIAFRQGSIAGYDDAATDIMPHAWMAGGQTLLLRRQLDAMDDGGVFVITVPSNPIRCPPGPYERASLVAAYFKREKPRSKILILDDKDTFFEQNLFEDGWRRHYGEMVEWLPAQFTGGIQSIDPARCAINTAGMTFKAGVANVIPPQCAGQVARDAGLADTSGWCPVDPATFESTRHADIHVVGDAAIAGKMPKSAYAANSQAKACAAAIVSALTGREQAGTVLSSTCYTLLGPDDAIGDAISFKLTHGTIDVAEVAVSALSDSAGRRAQTVREADAWYDAFTQDVFG